MSRGRKRSEGQGVPPAREDDAGLDQDERDEWRDLGRWIVPAQDEKGHSSEKMLRLQPALERMISIIVADERIPYETFGDFSRHALLRHARYVSAQLANMPTHFLAGLRAMNLILSDNHFQARMEQVFRDLDTRMQSHLSRAELGEAMRLVAAIRQEAAQMPDSAWKRKFIARFEESCRGIIV